MPRHLEVRERVDDPGRHGGHEDRGGTAPFTPVSKDLDGNGGNGERAPSTPAPPAAVVQRVQTGVRMEKRLVKVLKALAELYDRSLGDLLEGIVLHAFEGRSPFSADALRRIAELQRIYGLDLAARAGQLPLEPSEPQS